MANIKFTITNFDEKKGTVLVEFEHPSGNLEKTTTKNVRLTISQSGLYRTGQALLDEIASVAPFRQWKEEQDAEGATNAAEIQKLVGVSKEVDLPDDPSDPVMV